MHFAHAVHQALYDRRVLPSGEYAAVRKFQNFAHVREIAHDNEQFSRKLNPISSLILTGDAKGTKMGITNCSEAC